MKIAIVILITLTLAGCKPRDDTTAQVFGSGNTVVTRDSTGKYYVVEWRGVSWKISTDPVRVKDEEGREYLLFWEDSRWDVRVVKEPKP